MEKSRAVLPSPHRPPRGREVPSIQKWDSGGEYIRIFQMKLFGRKKHISGEIREKSSTEITPNVHLSRDLGRDAANILPSPKTIYTQSNIDRRESKTVFPR